MCKSRGSLLPFGPSSKVRSRFFLFLFAMCIIMRPIWLVISISLPERNKRESLFFFWIEWHCLMSFLGHFVFPLKESRIFISVIKISLNIFPRFVVGNLAFLFIFRSFYWKTKNKKKMSKAKKCLVQSIDNQKIISIQNNIQIRFEGILIYEMLAGYPPFFDDNPFGIYEKILAGKIDWPRHMDPIAKDLVKKLLVQDRTKRLGNMKVSRFILFHSMHMWQHLMRWRQNGADDVKRHRWFKGLDWDDVFYRKLKVKINVARHLFQFHLISFFFLHGCVNVKPPIVPKVSYDGDTCNFDEYPEADWQRTPCVTEKDYKLFESF